MAESNPSSLYRERDLYIQAIAIKSPDERARFLDEACADNLDMRARLSRLVETGEQDTGWLDPAGYRRLLTEQENIARDLREESEFLNELGKSIRLLDEEYELIEEIGRGTTGVVYRAKQRSLGREVAVKIVLGSTLSSPVDRQRFRLEVEAAAALRHPHTVPVYEVGRHGSYDFFSMALMTGGTLSRLIGDNGMDPRRAARMIITIGQALQAAHTHGVIHCDLKPDNILLDERGQPHISDFGLSYHPGRPLDSTLPTGIMGSPQYMSPEQADPTSEPLATATDIYSLGVIFYELLSGVPPFQSDSLLELLRLVKEQPPRPLRTFNTAIDRDLETVVLKCLEKRPDRRYESVSALIDDIEAWLERRPIKARPMTSLEAIGLWVRRRPTHAMLLAVSSMLLLVLGVGGPLVAWNEAGLRREAEAARVTADAAREFAEQEHQDAVAQRQAALEAEANAQRTATENRALAYAYGSRLAAAAAEIDRGSLAAHGILKTLIPPEGEPDLRGWEWYYSFADVTMRERVIKGSDPVQAVGFSPQGSLVACSHRGQPGIVIRDGFHGAIVRELDDPTGEHRDFFWTLDEKRLITLSESGVVKLWDPGSGCELATLLLGSPVLALSWVPDARCLVGLTADNLLRVWQLDDADNIAAVHEHAPEVDGLTKIAVSPDGRYLAAINDSDKVYLWAWAGIDQPPGIFSGHEGRVIDLIWHRDSRWLATRGVDNMVRVWEVPAGARLAKLSHTEERVTAFAWDPNGFQFFCGADNGHWCRTDMLTSKHQTLANFPDEVSAIGICGITHTALFGFADGALVFRRYNLPEIWNEFLRHDDALVQVSWNNNGTMLACRSSAGDLLLVHAAKGKRLGERYAMPTGPVTSLAWNPVQADEIVVFTQQGSDTVVERMSAGENDRQAIDKLQGVGVISSSWGRGNGLLTALTTDNILVTWDMEQDTEPRTTRIPQEADHSQVSYSPNGRWLVATGDPMQIGVFDTKTGRSWPIPIPGNAPRPVFHTWHPSGHLLASANKDGSVWVWDLRTRQRVSHFKTTSNTTPVIAWHPDGLRLACTGNDRRVTLWDWETGEMVYSIATFERTFTSLAWSPDGMRLAATNNYKQLLVFDATAGYLINRQAPPHAAP